MVDINVTTAARQHPCARRSVVVADPYPRRPTLRSFDLAAEGRARYGSAPGRDAVDGAAATATGPVAAAAATVTGPVDAIARRSLHGVAQQLSAVEASVDGLAPADLDELSDGELDDLLRRLRRPIAQLVGLRSRAAADSQARRLSASENAPTGATLREHQRQLAVDQRLSASQAKREIEAGRAARDHDATRAAFVDGAIDPEQARMIARVLEQLPTERRDELEGELLALARRLDAVAFGRAARAILAKQSPTSAAQDERRRHLSRRIRATDTPDGGFAFSGLLYGAAAEHARVALDAFRRPDGSDEHRSPEQRSADAFEQLCAAALRSGAASTSRGVRPHVVVVVDAAQLAAWRTRGAVAGARFAGSGQPVTSQEFGSLLSDCEVTRLALDAAGTPIEASEAVRTVPIGLWRALLVRDGGCTWQGCDAPASWCDVAHGHTPFAASGRLSPSNAALLCRRHHRRFDRGGHRIVIDGDSVSYRAVDSPAHPGRDGEESCPTAPNPPGRRDGRPDRGDRSSIGARAPTQPAPPASARIGWDQAPLPGADPP